MNKKNEILNRTALVQNDRDLECGRSMVEMLGVLAVIGVLSVAGIAAYSNAMKKYKANELLNEVSKRATIVAMQIASGKSGANLSLSEFGNNTVQGITIAVDTSYAAGDKTFAFNLSSTGTELNDICTQMQTTAGDNSFMKIESDCSKITFNADLSRGVSTGSATSKDADGFCLRGYLPPDCTEKVTCSPSQEWTENGCVCDNGKFGANCDSDCDGVYGVAVSAWGNNCQSCSNGRSITTTQAECDKCPNRTYANGKCTLATCPYGEFKVGSYCQSCTDLVYSYPATEAECDKCPNREYADGKCRLKTCPTGYAAPTEDYANCVYQVPTNQQCQWTEWFDEDFPKYEAGGGDFETYENIRARGGAVCAQPMEIECEAEDYPGKPIQVVGQYVHCDLKQGLICKNDEQSGVFAMCIDYRVRVLCCEDT